MDECRKAKAISRRGLRRIHRLLNHSNKQDAQVWLALLLGFYGLLRASELLRIQYHDITLRKWGIRVSIPFSKTDPRPVEISICKGDDILCPVQALASVMASTPSPTPTSDVFDFNYSYFNNRLKSLCAEAGLRGRYSTHSLRRGGTTAMFAAGVPDQAIKAHGRWKSMAWHGYVQFEERLLRQAPTALLHSRRSLRVRRRRRA